MFLGKILKEKLIKEWSFQYYIYIYIYPIFMLLMGSHCKKSKKKINSHISSWVLFNYEPKRYNVYTSLLPLNQVTPSLKSMLLSKHLIKKTCFVHVLVVVLCKPHIICAY